MLKKLFLFVVVSSLLIHCRVYAQEPFVEMTKVEDVIAWIETNHPQSLNLGKTDFQPEELSQIKKKLPEGCQFLFEAVFRKALYTQDTESINLNGDHRTITCDDLENLIDILPNIKSIDVSEHNELSNNEMPDFCDAHPDIRFNWIIKLPYSHKVLSFYTAYSTLNRAGEKRRMSDQSLYLFKYAPEIRALDMGHNNIKDLSFLQYLPELRLLIMADNKIEDISAIGGLKKLQYCEIFLNYYSDLSPLSQCTELLDLNVAYTNVTSLDGLDGCTKLERLWAPRERQLDPDSIERFKAKHPNCELTFNSAGSTGNGWRQHWRYKHYLNLFKTHDWIPFEESNRKPADWP